MKTKTIYVCEICSFESTDIESALRCEKRIHFKSDKQFETITKEMIESFRPRLEALRARDKKLAIDSGPVSLYHVLYSTYVRGHYTTLNAALSEIEKLYTATSCYCSACSNHPEKGMENPILLPFYKMILCPECGNKRCPKASHHDNACTKSNEPGQPGSIF